MCVACDAPLGHRNDEHTGHRQLRLHCPLPDSGPCRQRPCGHRHRQADRARVGDYFRFVHGNILDDGAVDSAMPGVDLIIHLAAEHKDFGVPESLSTR